jgi:hypothetical protein
MNKPEKQRTLLVNRWMTPDGTILQSKDRHDFVGYTDADGASYYVDGGVGGYYIRVSGNLTSMCLYDDDEHSEIRKYFSWKSYGKDGEQPGEWFVLKDMTSEHIRAIIETQRQLLGTPVLEVFKNELKFRGTK